MAENTQTVDEYIASLPEERREVVQAARKAIRDNLQPGIQESMAGSMIGYAVPHSVYPPGYHCNPKQPLQFAAIASQKNYVAIHLPFVYCDESLRVWLQEKWMESGKKLDMGKGCLRVKRLDDLNADALGELVQAITVERLVSSYESALNSRRG